MPQVDGKDKFLREMHTVSFEGLDLKGGIASTISGSLAFLAFPRIKPWFWRLEG